ncbi:probable glutamate receptor [Panulirus ornatus]|uniref:probable glutamate receptor n=1 Tax=Panulirus ornatus TaxID=150431 RepID=UPI003A83AC98
MWKNLIPEGGRDVLDEVGEVVGAVLEAASEPRCSVILLTDGTIPPYAVFKVIDQLEAPWGVGMFEVTAGGQDANTTQAQLSRVIGEARKLRQMSWCVTVVVVSDDPAFLTAFAKLSLKGRLLVWSGRLLIVTRLPILALHDLHRTFAERNAMLIIVDDTPASHRCSMYLHLPYSLPGSQPLLVASWTPHRGLALTTHLPLFPDKFSKFLQSPNLMVASEAFVSHRPVIIKDPKAPGGKRLTFVGLMEKFINYISQGINFTYTYVRPSDGTWGTKKDDGSWSGMMGMVSREEVDVSVGPLTVSLLRAEVVDFTYPLTIQNMKLLAGLGNPEVDPWGFLMPLRPLVWAAILSTLVVVFTAMLLLSSFISGKIVFPTIPQSNVLITIRVILQQDISEAGRWWWYRLVLGVWMMMTLVLTRSYAGNLMSLLAVRHIPQPYQTLRDVLDDPSVTMIWQKGSANVQYMQSAQSGIYREVADLEKEGRLIYRTVSQYPQTIDTLVKRGDHVLLLAGMGIKRQMARDLQQSGYCSLYGSREELLSRRFAMIGPMDSPLIPAMNKRILRVAEAGLFDQWRKIEEPYGDVCLFFHAKMTRKASLSLNNVWGMFVVLVMGHAFSLLELAIEIFIGSFHSFF